MADLTVETTADGKDQLTTKVTVDGIDHDLTISRPLGYDNITILDQVDDKEQVRVTIGTDYSGNTKLERNLTVGVAVQPSDTPPLGDELVKRIQNDMDGKSFPVKDVQDIAAAIIKGTPAERSR